MGIYLRGGTYWFDLRYKPAKGGRIRRPVASIKAVGKKKAHKAAADAYVLVKAQIASKTFDLAAFEREAGPDAGGVLFERAVELYIEHRIAQGRVDASYARLREWLPVFEGRPLASITTDEIEERLIAWTTERKLKPASRNRLLMNLAGMLSYAYGRRWIDAHPTERGRIPRLAENNQKTRWLRVQEIDAIVAAAQAMAAELDGTGNRVVNDHGKARWLAQTFPALFRFGCMSGMRVSEVCGLKRSSYQVDSKGGAFVVTEKRTKNGTFLRWPLAGEALTIVEAQLGAIPDKPSAYLFPGPWGASSYGAIKRSFEDIVTRAKLVYGRDCADGITWHTTRHTMASLALNNGIPEPIVMVLGNWKSRALVARYSHLGDETAREAAEKVASIVGSGHTLVTTKPALAKSAVK